MPIYEYQCQCGAIFESLESLKVTREVCGEQCDLEQAKKSGFPVRHGHVVRYFSPPKIRGDGREAKEPTFDPVRRANRPYSDCEHDG